MFAIVIARPGSALIALASTPMRWISTVLPRGGRMVLDSVRVYEVIGRGDTSLCSVSPGR